MKILSTISFSIAAAAAAASAVTSAAVVPHLLLRFRRLHLRPRLRFHRILPIHHLPRLLIHL